MTTRLQKKLAEAIINDVGEGRPVSGQKLLEKVGYSKNLAKQSGRVIRSKGVQKELANLGFTEENAKKVVAEILHNETAKDHDRLDAADKIFKVQGSYAPEKNINVNVEIEPSPEIKELTKKLNALYGGASVPSDGGISGSMDTETSN